MQKTFDTYSFGCRVNTAEMESLSRELSLLGFVQIKANPAILIINTCAVTKKAEREARQLIYQMKKKLPQTKIIATGCAATKWNIEKVKIPGVDFLFDNTDKEYLATVIQHRTKTKNSKLKIQKYNSKVKSENNQSNNIAIQQFNHKKALLIQNTYHDKYLDSGRLLLKIQDGCHRFCTFCIVPYLRGLPTSKSVREIVKIIRFYMNKKSYITPPAGDLIEHKSENIVVQNVQEVILAAINTEAYGRETGETFIQLIDAIIRKTTVPRISFGSIHPWSITNEFLDFYKKVLPKSRLVNFLHIPLQSGSNKILLLMKRGYTREEFLEKLHKLEKINPMVFIGTDIITGFLEESEKDFEDTYHFLTDSPISKFHIFRFSPRERTAAYFMKKRLHEPTSLQKQKRAKILALLNEQKYSQFLSKHIGKSFSALILKKRENGFQSALLDNQIPVLVKTSKDLAGEINNVKIKEMNKGALIASII